MELTLDARRHLVNERVKAFSQFSISFEGLGCLPDEVLSIVVGDGIHRTIVVGLCLKVNHLAGGLKANFKLFAVYSVHLISLLLHVLEIVGALSWLLFNHLSQFGTELLSLHGDTSSDQRPTDIKLEQLGIKVVKLLNVSYEK